MIPITLIKILILRFWKFNVNRYKNKSLPPIPITPARNPVTIGHESVCHSNDFDRICLIFLLTGLKELNIVCT
jgi:hypothetical protein